MKTASESILDFGFGILDLFRSRRAPASNSKSKIQNLKSARRAYTLAEMLIVITIMIMLVAAALPVAKKVMDGSQVREASRQLNAYLAMARTRTLQTGRPCGIFFAFNQPLVPDPFEQTLNQPAQFKSYWPVRQTTQMYLSEI